jgi:hypothetical protein
VNVNVDVERVNLARPLPLGASIGHPLGTAGALGLFIIFANGRRGILGASTVLSPKGAKRGDYIHQPSPLEGPLTGQTRVAELIAPLQVGSEGAAGLLQAAALLDEVETTHNQVPIPGVSDASLRRVADPKALNPGDDLLVLVRGCVAKPARLTAIEVKDDELGGCFTITGERSDLIAPGDAGALVYRPRDRTALGLVVAADGPQVFVAPLHRALDDFGAAIAS